MYVYTRYTVHDTRHRPIRVYTVTSLNLQITLFPVGALASSIAGRKDISDYHWCDRDIELQNTSHFSWKLRDSMISGSTDPKLWLGYGSTDLQHIQKTILSIRFAIIGHLRFSIAAKTKILYNNGKLIGILKPMFLHKMIK